MLRRIHQVLPEHTLALHSTAAQAAVRRKCQCRLQSSVSCESGKVSVQAAGCRLQSNVSYGSCLHVHGHELHAGVKHHAYDDRQVLTCCQSLAASQLFALRRGGAAGDPAAGVSMAAGSPLSTLQCSGEGWERTMLHVQNQLGSHA